MSEGGHKVAADERGQRFRHTSSHIPFMEGMPNSSSASVRSVRQGARLAALRELADEDDWIEILAASRSIERGEVAREESVVVRVFTLEEEEMAMEGRGDWSREAGKHLAAAASPIPHEEELELRLEKGLSPRPGIAEATARRLFEGPYRGRLVARIGGSAQVVLREPTGTGVSQ